MNILLSLFILASFSMSKYSVDATTVMGSISQTTTFYAIPPTFTSTFHVTQTPAISVKMETETASPLTSLVVSVTVANINVGRGKSVKMPEFIKSFDSLNQ